MLVQQPRAGGFRRADTSQALPPIPAAARYCDLATAVILREREARTLGPLISQGVTGARLYQGKLLALSGLIGFLSLPALLFSSIFRMPCSAGESLTCKLDAVYRQPALPRHVGSIDAARRPSWRARVESRSAY